MNRFWFYKTIVWSRWRPNTFIMITAIQQSSAFISHLNLSAHHKLFFCIMIQFLLHYDPNLVLCCNSWSADIFSLSVTTNHIEMHDSPVSRQVVGGHKWSHICLLNFCGGTSNNCMDCEERFQSNRTSILQLCARWRTRIRSQVMKVIVFTIAWSMY